MNRCGHIRVVFLTLVALLAAGLSLPAWAQPANVTTGQAIYHDTSPRLDHIPPANPGRSGENRQIPNNPRVRPPRFPDLAEPDGGLQTQASAATQLGPTPGPIVSISGLSEDNNAAILGYRTVPPDVNGDIGLDGSGKRIYVQYINSIWGVFSATTGNLVAGPYPGNSIWQGFGGFCQTNNDGDPVVLYDDPAGRWVMSQFSIDEGIQCMAVSKTSDPLGEYYRYAFEVSPGKQNDYPKLGVWTDDAGQSAYTFTTRDFPCCSTGFMGTGVMERDQMLHGLNAQFIKYINPCNSTSCIEGQLPPHLAGSPPPAGTCPTFWTAVDAAYDDSPYANDGYRNHTLCVDWSNLNNSTYTEGSFVPAGSNFDRNLGDINPINGGERLNSLPYFTMFRAQYRWFGAYGSVVLNTTVDAGNERAGIRWAEVRSADGDTGWFRQQDGTFAPDDGLERWMGSIAQDRDGNIALGYTVAGSSLFPSVRYNTRLAGDPAGTLPGGEVSCVEGTGAQAANSYNRWGDYSSMSIDPSDDCTFWYTQEYYETTGSFDFNTRICSFKIPGCGGPTTCTVDADCDNGLYCDGVETCNAGTCQTGTPPDCDDGTFCNGAETCSVATNSCAPGTPPTCDDEVSCTVDSCNSDSDSCTNVPNDGLCDNGQFCDGAETCDTVNGCQAGTAECTGSLETCDEGADTCVPSLCNNNGICENGEDCDNCSNDCISGPIPQAVCGNGLCEAGDGETGVNCPADCASILNGKPSGRFSCGYDDGYAPDGCGDSRCTSGNYACTENPTGPGRSFCCGDAICEGEENSSSCGLDCGPPPPAPECGNDVIEDGEICDGSSLGGETCSSMGFDGGSLTCLADCSGYDTSNCTAGSCELGQPGDSCSADSDCCSNKCKGKPGSKTCN